jgi:hypothetical protein
MCLFTFVFQLHIFQLLTNYVVSDALVLTKHLNGEYCLPPSSHPMRRILMNMLRHRPHKSNVAVEFLCYKIKTDMKLSLKKSRYFDLDSRFENHGSQE